MDFKLDHQDQEEDDESSEEGPLEGFRDTEKYSETYKEGKIYLKTKSMKYKEFNAILTGTDLFLNRKKNELMHCLVDTYVKKMD